MQWHPYTRRDLTISPGFKGKDSLKQNLIHSQPILRTLELMYASYGETMAMKDKCSETRHQLLAVSGDLEVKVAPERILQFKEEMR